MEIKAEQYKREIVIFILLINFIYLLIGIFFSSKTLLIFISLSNLFLCFCYLIFTKCMSKFESAKEYNKIAIAGDKLINKINKLRIK